MTESPILVTSAAGGKQGATGRHIVRMLRERGLPVRAFVHRIDQRSDALTALGAEVVPGDFMEFFSVRKALDGVKRAYFSPPVQEGLLDATAIFAEAGREVGLEVCVNNSHFNASPKAASPRTRQHWLSERVLDWADIGGTHLRGSLFYENFRRAVAGGVATDSKMYAPLGEHGEQSIAMCAGEDVARVGAAILAEPGDRVGKVHHVSGPPQTPTGMAKTLSEALERPIQYVPISFEAFRQQLIEREGADRVAEVTHLSILWGDILRKLRRDEMSDIMAEMGGPHNLEKAVRDIGGEPPKTLHDFIVENAEVFGGIGPST